jgi:hypothetical protein
MFTDAGNEAVHTAYTEILREYGPPQTNQEVYDRLRKITELVKQMGEGQVNPNKDYPTETIEGFNEVTDTVVRDGILDWLDGDMEEALKSRP